MSGLHVLIVAGFAIVAAFYLAVAIGLAMMPS